MTDSTEKFFYCVMKFDADPSLGGNLFVCVPGHERIAQIPLIRINDCSLFWQNIDILTISKIVLIIIPG